jgi:hypothetical protein
LLWSRRLRSEFVDRCDRSDRSDRFQVEAFAFDDRFDWFDWFDFDLDRTDFCEEDGADDCLRDVDSFLDPRASPFFEPPSTFCTTLLSAFLVTFLVTCFVVSLIVSRIPSADAAVALSETETATPAHSRTARSSQVRTMGARSTAGAA